MPAKRLWAKVALVTLFSMTGCCSWCEKHCGQTAQPVSSCQPCCNPCYQAPAYAASPCCSPCAPAPGYAPPPAQWVQPVPQAPPR